MRVAGIVNNGTTVTIIGRNTRTDGRVYVHFDHRCFAVFWANWLARGAPPIIAWDADRGHVSFDHGGIDG